MALRDRAETIAQKIGATVIAEPWDEAFRFDRGKTSVLWLRPAAFALWTDEELEAELERLLGRVE